MFYILTPVLRVYVLFLSKYKVITCLIYRCVRYLTVLNIKEGVEIYINYNVDTVIIVRYRTPYPYAGTGELQCTTGVTGHMLHIFGVRGYKI